MIPVDSVELDTRSETSESETTVVESTAMCDEQFVMRKDKTDVVKYIPDYRICRALYHFDGNSFTKMYCFVFCLPAAYVSYFIGTSSGELTVSEGTQMYVLEEDTGGTGWTKVQINEDIGYVPTTYIDYV